MNRPHFENINEPEPSEQGKSTVLGKFCNSAGVFVVTVFSGGFMRLSLLAVAAVLFGTMDCRAAWELAWHDDFDTPGLPNATNWNYETGYVRNHEAQYYTSGRKENARVEKGMLVIEARKERFGIPGNTGTNEAQYTSASINTRGKVDFTYGRLEIRAKLPAGKGVWPAFWTLGEQGDWPACGEIDIMEFVGKEPGMVHGTIHYAGAAGEHKQSGSEEKIKKASDGFHIYAVEWFPTRIDFFIDGHKYHTVNLADANRGGQNPFREPHYLLLNFAIGGDWGGEIDDRIFPQRYVIDYVRVYKWTDR